LRFNLREKVGNRRWRLLPLPRLFFPLAQIRSQRRRLAFRT
jgi:hypothetical protein